MIKKIIGIFLLSTSLVLASTDRYLDGQFITNGSDTLTIPAITDTLSTGTLTQTFTNKTISGASNTISNIAAGSSLTGQVPVANGGTGAATLTSNGIVYGNGTSAVGVTSAGSQYQVYQAGASGVPTVGALNLAQSAAVTGALGVANGGTGSTSLTSGNVVIGNGTSAVSLVAPGTSGNVLTSNGSTWTSAAVPSTSPNVVGSTGSPTLITAVGGISFSGTNYTNYNFIAGDSAPIVVTATPQITAATNVGQRLFLIGEDATNTVTLADGNGLSLNGAWVGALNSVLELLWDGTNWVETARR